VPEGQLQGVTELVEHAGRVCASAAGATRVRVVRDAESFIVVNIRSERRWKLSRVAVAQQEIGREGLE